MPLLALAWPPRRYQTLLKYFLYWTEEQKGLNVFLVLRALSLETTAKYSRERGWHAQTVRQQWTRMTEATARWFDVSGTRTLGTENVQLQLQAQGCH
ncbi:hypothetical protein PoB_004875000 [Plakobranchus ocellatus]|uniref:Uncharacterized protein n=1 Tax=Plakobranchus ocellatus TaxID=259542 RepID=A0AAV4BT17_9GAST|nr:hypothetical protein PoB_004875000 [Plakobranchus ocellatus]